MRKNLNKHTINRVRVWPLFKKYHFIFTLASDITFAQFSTDHISHTDKKKIINITKKLDPNLQDKKEVRWIHDNFEEFAKYLSWERRSYGKVPLHSTTYKALPVVLFKSGIYMLTNKINKKKYVGKSKNLYERLITHNKYSWDTEKHNTNINRALKKYKTSNFFITLLEYCKEQDLGSREQHYIDNIKPQYNIRKSVHKSTKNGDAKRK